MAGGGNTTQTSNVPGCMQQALHDPLAQARADVNQLHAVQRAITGGGGGYVATGYISGGNGGAGGVYLSSTQPYAAYATTIIGGGNVSNTWGSPISLKPVFDPGWYNTYLEARDAAVMERLSGD